VSGEPAIFVDGMYKVERRMLERAVDQYRFAQRTPPGAKLFDPNFDMTTLAEFPIATFVRVGRLPDGVHVYAHDVLGFKLWRYEYQWTEIEALRRRDEFEASLDKHLKCAVDAITVGRYLQFYDQRHKHARTRTWSRLVMGVGRMKEGTDANP